MGKESMRKIVSAWRDLDVFEGLSDSEKADIPRSPAGPVKLRLINGQADIIAGTSMAPGGTCDTSMSPDGCCSSSMAPGGTCDTSMSPDGCCASSDAACNSLADC